MCSALDVGQISAHITTYAHLSCTEWKQLAEEWIELSAEQDLKSYQWSPSSATSTLNLIQLFRKSAYEAMFHGTSGYFWTLYSNKQQQQQNNNEWKQTTQTNNKKPYKETKNLGQTKPQPTNKATCWEVVK